MVANRRKIYVSAMLLRRFVILACIGMLTLAHGPIDYSPRDFTESGIEDVETSADSKIPSPSRDSHLAVRQRSVGRSKSPSSYALTIKSHIDKSGLSLSAATSKSSLSLQIRDFKMGSDPEYELNLPLLC